MRAAIEIFKELELSREDSASDAREADQVVPSIRQSILKAAFEGRLVAQDPRDEPADHLLARLSEQNETPRHPAARDRRVALRHSPSRIK